MQLGVKQYSIKMRLTGIRRRNKSFTAVPFISTGLENDFKNQRYLVFFQCVVQVLLALSLSPSCPHLLRRTRICIVSVSQTLSRPAFGFIS